MGLRPPRNCPAGTFVNSPPQEGGSGFSRRLLPERLKTDQGNIARLERGRTQATLRTLQRIIAATAYRLSVEFRPIPKSDK
jgi:transcriptional regulator with XRE-family HTH domain